MLPSKSTLCSTSSGSSISHEGSRYSPRNLPSPSPLMERQISEGIRIIELETQALFHEQRTPIKAATERLAISEELHKCKMRGKIYEETAANYTNVSSSAVEFEDHHAKIESEFEAEQNDEENTNNLAWNSIFPSFSIIDEHQQSQDYDDGQQDYHASVKSDSPTQEPPMFYECFQGARHLEGSQMKWLIALLLLCFRVNCIYVYRFHVRHGNCLWHVSGAIPIAIVIIY